MGKTLRYTAAVLVTALMLFAVGCGKEEQEPQEPQPVEQEQQEEPQQEDQVQETSEVDPPSLQAQITGAKAKNDEIIGWLRIDDTEIDGAVVQAENNTKYERLNEWGEYSWTGTFFADYECNFTGREELSKNTVIYGHNVHYDDDMNGERFSQLFHFTDQDFARNHPYVYFSIAGDAAENGENTSDDMVWQVFAVFYTTTDFDYIRINKDYRDPSQGEITDAQLMNIITEARDRSEYDYDVQVSPTDKILTLSTCSYKYGRRDDVRFVVMAKLVEEDAALQATASLTVNADKKSVE